MPHPLSPGHDELREGALESAIILRDCSFKMLALPPEQRDCRTLMRDQAFKWRRATILYR
jgi:hypothetical protein